MAFVGKVIFLGAKKNASFRRVSVQARFATHLPTLLASFEIGVELGNRDAATLCMVDPTAIFSAKAQALERDGIGPVANRRRVEWQALDPSRSQNCGCLGGPQLALSVRFSPVERFTALRQVIDM